MFWNLKERIKDKCYVFGGYKERSKVSLVYLERELQQHRYGWYIFKLKCQKMEEKTYLERSKQ